MSKFQIGDRVRSTFDERRTMTCPMGNHQIPVGQNSLLAHIPCPTHHKKVNK